jgi:6-phosphogluconolactonase/glucosamine-6-phosphate isomerase/deaminase
MTFGALRAAAEVWVLASGVGKDAALQESLAPGSTTPLGLILARYGPTKVFTDIRAG